MPGGRSPTQKRMDDARQHETRAVRILDAAAALILRQGYYRTTVEEIAREAGVGKGTLYLHWETREALFSALILREKIAMAADIQERVGRDPAGATLHGLLKHAALALMQRPLLKAVLLHDTSVYGAVVQREKDSFPAAEALAGFSAYLQVLREQGLARTDLSPREEAAILGSIFLGFFLAAPLLPEAFRPADEELAELIAETAQRALEPGGAIQAAAVETAAGTLAKFMDRSTAVAQDRILGDGQAEEVSPAVAAEGGQGGGRKSGRAMIAEARRMYAERAMPVAEICAALGISRASLYRYLKDG